MNRDPEGLASATASLRSICRVVDRQRAEAERSEAPGDEIELSFTTLPGDALLDVLSRCDAIHLFRVLCCSTSLRQLGVAQPVQLLLRKKLPALASDQLDQLLLRLSRTMLGTGRVDAGESMRTLVLLSIFRNRRVQHCFPEIGQMVNAFQSPLIGQAVAQMWLGKTQYNPASLTREGYHGDEAYEVCLYPRYAQLTFGVKLSCCNEVGGMQSALYLGRRWYNNPKFLDPRVQHPAPLISQPISEPPLPGEHEFTEFESYDDIAAFDMGHDYERWWGRSDADRKKGDPDDEPVRPAGLKCWNGPSIRKYHVEHAMEDLKSRTGISGKLVRPYSDECLGPEVVLGLPIGPLLPGEGFDLKSQIPNERILDCADFEQPTWNGSHPKHAIFRVNDELVEELLGWGKNSQPLALLTEELRCQIRQLVSGTSFPAGLPSPQFHLVFLDGKPDGISW